MWEGGATPSGRVLSVMVGRGRWSEKRVPLTKKSCEALSELRGLALVLAEGLIPLRSTVPRQRTGGRSAALPGVQRFRSN